MTHEKNFKVSVMTLWKVDRYFRNGNGIIFKAIPYDLNGHLKCCFKWYGIKGLKWCYLFKKQAERKARKLNKCLKQEF